jgi:glycosyltransferase involved in cell wall biosynthesis
MPVIYRMANVYILPSKGPGETWGLALNEAMASGIPVLASAKVGGAIDLIAPDVNGMIFELGEAEKVACFISRLSSDSTFYERVSTACRNRVQEFSYVKLVGNISRALNAVPDRSRMLN